MEPRDLGVLVFEYERRHPWRWGWWALAFVAVMAPLGAVMRANAPDAGPTSAGSWATTAAIGVGAAVAAFLWRRYFGTIRLDIHAHGFVFGDVRRRRVILWSECISWEEHRDRVGLFSMGSLRIETTGAPFFLGGMGIDGDMVRGLTAALEDAKRPASGLRSAD